MSICVLPKRQAVLSEPSYADRRREECGNMKKYKEGDRVRVLSFPWEGKKGTLLNNPERAFDWRVKFDMGAHCAFNEDEIEHYHWWKFWR